MHRSPKRSCKPTNSAPIERLIITATIPNNTHDEGYEAAERGEPKSSNPYDGGDDGRNWNEGWDDYTAGWRRMRRDRGGNTSDGDE